jgi:subtilisin family serine protease
MNKLKKIFIIFTISALLTPCFNINLVQASTEADMDQTSIIVKFKNTESPKKIILKSKQTIDEAINYYSKKSNVDYAEPDYLVHASMIPSDPYFTNQWYLKRIKAAEAWDYNTKSPTIVIAIIDSGVQILHPDLKPNIWVNSGEIAGNNKDDDHDGYVDDINGWDFVNNFADPSPKFKLGFTESGVIHGTVVAGIAAAAGNNEEGISGITWQTKIMSLKALDDKGTGDTSAVIKALDYAVLKGANIINLSFVGFAYSRSLEEAIKRAYDAGVIVVAPAGNEQATNNGLNLDQKPIYPACYHDATGKKLVVGVAATDGVDQKANFSGYGKSCIDLAAPGISFYSTTVYAPDKSASGKFFNQFYDGYWSGTSMAVPVISGALALIEGTNPALSSKQALDILLGTTDDISQLNLEYLGQLGTGRVNLAQAVLEATLKLKSHRARLAIAPASNDQALINILDSGGNLESQFLAYDEKFKGGVNLASGDVNKDGNDEIIVAPNKGLESNIKIFSSDGVLIKNFLAYPYSFKGGVNVAAGDIDGDGQAEIITAPKSGFEPLVKVFKINGKLINSFLAYPSNFKLGVNVAVGNVRDNELPEIVTAPERGGLPQIKIYSSQGKLLNYFMVGTNKEIYGWHIALADLDANPRRRSEEIILSRESGAPIVATYDYKGNKRNQWSAYLPPFTGNVNIMAADLNRDGFTDIITVPALGAAPHFRIFNYQGSFNWSFYAYPPDLNKGVAATIFLTNN